MTLLEFRSLYLSYYFQLTLRITKIPLYKIKNKYYVLILFCFLLPKSNCGWTPFNRQSGTTLERTLSSPSNAPNPLELKLGKTNSAMLQALVGAAHGLPSRLVCFERLVMMKIWRVVFILRAIRWNWTIATGNETAYWEMTRIWCFREWLIYTDHFWKLQVYFMALCCFNQGDYIYCF